MLNKLDKKIVEVIKFLNLNGGICYLTGGFVRDHFLGVQSYDVDIEVHNLSFLDLKDLLSTKYEIETIGKFAIIKIKDIPNLDIACPRQEKLIGKNHTDFDIEVDEHLDLEVATSRRDFTMNALMFNTKTEELFDFYNGINDIKNKKIKHVSDKFSEDNLRALRAFSFASRFNLTIDKSTLALIQNMEVTNLSKTRIVNEFEKIITSRYPCIGINLLSLYYPELFSLNNKIQCKFNRFVQGEFIVNTSIMLYLYSYYKEVTPYITQRKNDVMEIQKILNLLEFSDAYNYASKDKLFNILVIFDNYQYNCILVLRALQKCEFLEILLKKHETFKVGIEKYTGHYFLEKGCEPRKIKEFQKNKIIDML